MGAIPLFTIGFTRKTAEQFFTRLRQAGVRRLIDVLLVRIEKFLRRGQIEQMNVLNPGDLAQQIAEILFLGEPRQLRNIVQAHIDQASYTRLA